MRRTSLPWHATSRPGHLICPVCGSGELWTRRLVPLLTGCDSCEGAFDEVVLGTLEQMVTFRMPSENTPASAATPRCAIYPMGRSTAQRAARRYCLSRLLPGLHNPERRS